MATGFVRDAPRGGLDSQAVATSADRVSVPFGCQNSSQKRRNTRQPAARRRRGCAICRDKAVRADDQGLLAMQKVEGSSPFSRFQEVPAPKPFPRLPARSVRRAGRRFLRRWTIGGRNPRPESSAKALSTARCADGSSPLQPLPAQAHCCQQTRADPPATSARVTTSACNRRAPRPGGSRVAEGSIAARCEPARRAPARLTGLRGPQRAPHRTSARPPV
jgi:hypothetical protein